MSKDKKIDGNAKDLNDKDVQAQAAEAEAQAAGASFGADAGVAAQEETIARQLRQQRKVRIVIPSGRDASERAPVPVGVNGREFLIERDKEVDVPEGVINVLRLAVASVASAKAAGPQISSDFHKAERFSFRVIGWVNPETGELEKA